MRRPTLDALCATVASVRVARLRVALGLVTIFDLSFRLEDFHAFYDPTGPVFAHDAWSVFALSERPGFVVAIYALAFVAAVAFTVGLATPVASVVLVVLLRSLDATALLTLDGGDTVLLLMLLWMAFADSGAAFSLDARLGLRAPKQRVWAVPLVLVQLQLCVVYLYGGISKIESGWLHANVVQTVLLFPSVARAWAAPIARYERFCEALTLFTVGVELAFTPLVLSGRRRLRYLGLALGVALHLGIALSMRVGIFSLVMLSGYVAFLPEGTPASTPARLPRLPRLRLALIAIPIGLGLAAFFHLSTSVTNATFRLGLGQRWNMFTPPPMIDFRWRARGVTEGGSDVDVLAATIPELSGDPGNRYRRWLKVREGWTFSMRPQLVRLGRYLCRRYNAEHPSDKLFRFTLEFSSNKIGEPPSGFATVLEQRCVASSATLEDTPAEGR